MDQQTFYPVPTAFAKQAHINQEKYQALYQHSISNPAEFWAEQAKQFITWSSPWETVVQGDFNHANVEWFLKGQLNACYNCIDRHLETKKDQIALLWEGNAPDETQRITYQQLHDSICKFANVLKKYGVKKGDRVCIYLPMIPEIVIAMLACARIGAIHSVVFGGFSADALKTRLLDAECRLLITADEGYRGEKVTSFKKNSDLAVQECPAVSTVIVVKRTGRPVAWNATRDVWYHEAIQAVDATCPLEPMDSSAPLFILYTSGSTGKPKGVVHSTGGYMVYVAMTHQYVFDYHEGDIYWCGADIGWITGHSYLVYGPLANGATTLLFEGVPHYPTFSRYWEIIDKHQVSIFYTSPTAIRALRHEGDDWVKQTHRKSLKLLGTVGEPINPDVWEWYYEVVGEKRCPIVNTWWQTETGGILLTQFPGATPTYPGSVGWPFFGIVPAIVHDDGGPVKEGQTGTLIIHQPWPGLMKTIYGDPSRFLKAYFTTFPGAFLTGDGCYQMPAGNYWITGREDDVIKVSGHRISTAEVENALLTHPAVSEAAVIGAPDDIKGERIYAFVTTKASITEDNDLKQALIQQVRTKIGPLATPEHIQWADALPKTRSGKIMRRILRQIACHDFNHFGDTSTLADESVLDKLIKDCI